MHLYGWYGRFYDDDKTWTRFSFVCALSILIWIVVMSMRALGILRALNAYTTCRFHASQITEFFRVSCKNVGILPTMAPHFRVHINSSTFSHYSNCNNIWQLFGIFNTFVSNYFNNFFFTINICICIWFYLFRLFKCWFTAYFFPNPFALIQVNLNKHWQHLYCKLFQNQWNQTSSWIPEEIDRFTNAHRFVHLGCVFFFFVRILQANAFTGFPKSKDFGLCVQWNQ